MDMFFYITIVIGFSLIYYGYVKKRDYDLYIKVYYSKKNFALKCPSERREHDYGLYFL